jgi:mRNA-degrading endonuclease toxin of MazEF toxin-antitoxin module
MQKNPKEGEIWIIQETDGKAQKEGEERIAVVLSVPELRRIPIRVAVPVRLWLERHPDYAWLVAIAPGRAGVRTQTQREISLRADAKQCCALAVDLFLRKLGRVTPEELRMVREAVAMCIGVRAC